ncbi:MAG: HAMP domain-containing histidine kinase, partial [Anaerolineae bacterium]|nr:HAMP domain-containing histidine kinase [Anaerolineae bacterium]
MYLTAAAVSYLTQFILAALISGYLILIASRRPDRPQHTILLAAFFTAITVFIALLFLEAGFLPTQRLYAVYLENTALGIALVFLIQFAYRFPHLPASQRWEALLALVASGLYTAWEASFAVNRFIELGGGQVLFRVEIADLGPALLLIWVPVVLVRRVVYLSRAAQASSEGAAPGRTGSPVRHLWRPQGRPARAARAFAAIYLFVAGLGLVNILLTFYFVSRATYSGLLSLGILLALLAFAISYLNYLPETTSFMVKLVGGALTAMLAVLGAVVWVISPSFAAHFHPVLPEQRTLRFTPNAAGGYDVAEAPYAFVTSLGDNLGLTDDRARSSVGLDFVFPYYGQTYSRVFVVDDGTIAMGRPQFTQNYQYRYGGGVPLISALLVDLYPEISPGGVFARQESDRLVITWQKLPGFFRHDEVYTFQAVLYRDGAFDITHESLPQQIAYFSNDEPLAAPWLVGALPEAGSGQPGLTGVRPRQISLAALPVRGGPEGLVQDYNLELRRYLHGLFLPLAVLIVTATFLSLIVFPYLFRANLVRPLEALLAGVRQMNAGRYGVSVEVYYPDEIGFVTQAFNVMSAELGDLIRNLEARVAQRTDDLQQANAQLAQEVAELDAFSHTVAHDLKSSLTILTTGTGLLVEQAAAMSPEEIQTVSRLASDGAWKAIGVVDSLLLLARARKTRPEIEPLSMASIVQEAQYRLAEMIESSQAQVVAVDMASWPVALGYEPWVRQVWMNYLSNAIKYGGSPPHIELGARREPDGQVRFWVHNNGRSLGPAEQARLFTPFERLGQVEIAGHGLGLTIVKRIVETQGGRVGVESEPGQGSSFYFTLPAAPASGVAEQ